MPQSLHLTHLKRNENDTMCNVKYKPRFEESERDSRDRDSESWSEIRESEIRQSEIRQTKFRQSEIRFLEGARFGARARFGSEIRRARFRVCEIRERDSASEIQGVHLFVVLREIKEGVRDKRARSNERDKSVRGRAR